MIPNDNFGLPPGVWTDDTSMALCLAQSLATSKKFDEHDQMQAYVNWQARGELSAIGQCFDIGNTISRAIAIYTQCRNKSDAPLRIRNELGSESSSGNGSLMRVLPVALAYWRDQREARMYARSSITTHPNGLCQEACEVWIGAISIIMRAACNPSADAPLSKLRVLDYFVIFPYIQPKLREVLGLPPVSLAVPQSETEREEYYRTNHPILKLVAKSEPLPRQDELIPHIPTAQELPSSGYVLHTLVAALYCFLATSSLEEGAIMAVNLGDDADTIGAIYGGMARCWYAADKSEETLGLFWSSRVEEWQQALVRPDMIETVAEKLVVLNDKSGKAQ
ncbi:adp-ribosylation crystallin j1 [Moniliophthora roreri]|uniref:ADP-ribosylhydrolase ARH3 n=1 Tax=Moniliophthora roreri TaxID=221103 RepID=A0A0W0FUF1_MONRR|nr:adp-ribosylation crystallin j1 [Moniliophthora roreri]